MPEKKDVKNAVGLVESIATLVAVYYALVVEKVGVIGYFLGGGLSKVKEVFSAMAAIVTVAGLKELLAEILDMDDAEYAQVQSAFNAKLPAKVLDAVADKEALLEHSVKFVLECVNAVTDALTKGKALVAEFKKAFGIAAA